MSRRNFLKSSSLGAFTFGTTALTARGAGSANERLSIGIVGAGGRGQALMNEIHKLAEAHNVQISAVCDVWNANLDRAVAMVSKAFGKEPRKTTRFGELLAIPEVDAVVIATPDFTHAPIMIESLRAGKDVYVEKPMSLRIDLANEAMDLARKHGRVVQVGTQFRSHGGYAATAREIANGSLGRISRLSAQANFNQARWARGFDDCKEQDVDWEAFLMDLPQRPFDPKRFRRWQLYKDFTNGLAGLWMSHYVDAVHIITGAKYPSRAVALGGVYVWKDGREHSDTFHALLEYPEGFLFDWGMGLANSAGNGFAVYGELGTLEISKNYIAPESLLLSSSGGAEGSKVEQRALAPDSMPDQDVLTTHMANWLDCLRSRKLPNADIQFGHQHAVAVIMAAAALHTGGRQAYDPESRTIQAG
jgi:predicted dehydrogenase